MKEVEQLEKELKDLTPGAPEKVELERRLAAARAEETPDQGHVRRGKSRLTITGGWFFCPPVIFHKHSLEFDSQLCLDALVVVGMFYLHASLLPSQPHTPTPPEHPFR